MVNNTTSSIPADDGETYRTPTAAVLLYFCPGDEVLGACFFFVWHSFYISVILQVMKILI